MSRRLRYAPEGSVVEITMRTLHSRFLLRPSPQVNDVILGIIGRAQATYKVEIHALAFLSNHFHMLLSPPNAKALSDFMNYINSNIARKVGILHEWREKFWGQRYQSIVAADETSQVDRLRYILSHGCKEGLVARPTDWPGVHCAAALTQGTPLTGTWFDRTAASEARRRKTKKVDESVFYTEYTVTLTPLPCLAGMSPQAYRQYCGALVADIERETALRNAELGRQPLGRAAVLRQHPHDVPQDTKHSPAPLVHAATREARDRFRAAYHWFVDCFRSAAERLRQGCRDVVFPIGAFPPPAPFVMAGP